MLKFLRENVLQVVGGAHECWKYFTMCCSTSWEDSLLASGRSPWRRVAVSGARGSGEDRRSMGGGGGGSGVGCFLCNCPRLGWSQLQTAHFLSPLRVSKVRLVSKAAAFPVQDQIFLLSDYKSKLRTWVSSALTWRSKRVEE